MATMKMPVAIGGGVDISGYKIIEWYRSINSTASSVVTITKKSDGSATTSTTGSFSGNYFTYDYATSTITALQDAKFIIFTTDANATYNEVQIVDGTANEVVFTSGTSWPTWFSSINPATNNMWFVGAMVKI